MSADDSRHDLLTMFQNIVRLKSKFISEFNKRVLTFLIQLNLYQIQIWINKFNIK